MKHKLFIDSDTALEFKSRAKAFIYVDKNQLKSWMLLSVLDDAEIKDISDNSNDDVRIHQASVFNPFIVDTDKCVEWFKTESDALKYIGSFLTGGA